jgi:hypothetical protein
MGQAKDRKSEGEDGMKEPDEMLIGMRTFFDEDSDQFAGENSIMRDITERLRSGFGGMVPPVCDEAAETIESLRQQLDDLKVNHKAELVMRDQNSQMYLGNTRQQLAESQALVKVLRDALNYICG